MVDELLPPFVAAELSIKFDLFKSLQKGRGVDVVVNTIIYQNYNNDSGVDITKLSKY